MHVVGYARVRGAELETERRLGHRRDYDTDPGAVGTGSWENVIRAQVSQNKNPPNGGLFNLGRLRGLEPPTPGITIQYSNQLSYSRRRAIQTILSGSGWPVGTF